LTPDQQVECLYLKGAAVGKRMNVIDALSTEVLDHLRVAHMARPKARAQRRAPATIERRHLVWRCASMADWYPTRTANLYQALTGNRMTRPMAAKLIDEIRNDHKRARPPRARRRAKTGVRVERIAPKSGRGSKVRRHKEVTAKISLQSVITECLSPQ
jgi:hypothetical protein